MMDRTLNWGILSTANINRSFLPSLRASVRNFPLAIASRDINRSQSFAEEWGLPKAYGSYDSILQDPDVDIVYIPLPNGMHAEWTIKAAEAGKHVLCEKPIAMNSTEIDAISKAAKRTGLVLLEALMYRHHPQTLYVKETINKGSIGEILVIRGSFTIDLSRNLENIRLNPQLGGGSIWDVGSYPISYARFLVGSEPVEVYAEQIIGSSGVDESLVGHMRFPGNIFAQINCGFRSPFRMRMEVIGTKGAIDIPHPFIPDKHAEISIMLENETRVIPIRGQDLYTGEIDDITDTILACKSPRVSLEESRGNILAIEALINSALEGKPIHIA